MEIKKINLDSLKAEDTYSLSFPVRPEIYPTFARQFPGFPSIIINPEQVIIFGIDAYYFLKSQGETETDVLKIRISLKEGLLLNYNLKENLFGLNQLEKLYFLKKILPHSSPEEIHLRTQMEMAINKELIDNLEALIAKDLKTVLIKNRINLKYALKILKLTGTDRLPVIQLFEKHSFSTSHQLAILTMLEEIIFRDKTSVEDIFNRAGLERLVETHRPQKKIIRALFSLRFPFYSKAEESWESWVKKLELPRHIQIRHADFFEKKQLDLTLQFSDPKEVERVLNKIKK
jgi:hypothetical protein